MRAMQLAADATSTVTGAVLAGAAPQWRSGGRDERCLRRGEGRGTFTMGNKSTTAASRARRWATYAACAWCVAFGALHAWWALGIPFGFPGGEASYQVMANSPWRMVVDVIVVVMSVLGFLVVRALMQPAGPGGRALVARAMAWAAFALLTLRGGGWACR
jgi:cytochrome bd-type quinol oxidase subunit 2